MFSSVYLYLCYIFVALYISTANDRVNDAQANSTALRIIGSISSQKKAHSEQSSEPVLLFVNCSKVAQMMAGNEVIKNPLQAYGKDQSNKWARPITEDDFVMTKKQLESAQVICQMEESDIPLYDFENHMEGIGSEISERDWISNPAIAAKLKA